MAVEKNRKKNVRSALLVDEAGEKGKSELESVTFGSELVHLYILLSLCSRSQSVCASWIGKQPDNTGLTTQISPNTPRGTSSTRKKQHFMSVVCFLLNNFSESDRRCLSWCVVYVRFPTCFPGTLAVEVPSAKKSHGVSQNAKFRWASFSHWLFQSQKEINHLPSHTFVATFSQRLRRRGIWLSKNNKAAP